jgi:hypothetical protein
MTLSGHGHGKYVSSVGTAFVPDGYFGSMLIFMLTIGFLETFSLNRGGSDNGGNT